VKAIGKIRLLGFGVRKNCAKLIPMLDGVNVDLQCQSLAEIQQRLTKDR